MAKRFFGLGTLLFLTIAYVMDTEGMFLYVLASSLLHELGHLGMMFVCGAKLRRVEWSGFGFLLRFDGLLPYTHDALIAAGGVMMNLLTAFFFAQTAEYTAYAAEMCLAAGVNLLMGLFHLLPALPLDGGQVLLALLSCRLPEDWAREIVRRISLAIGVGLLIFGVYILIKTRYNISILALCGLIFGGTYAQRSGNRPAKGAKARALCRRRIRTDQKRSEPDRSAGSILLPGRL